MFGSGISSVSVLWCVPCTKSTISTTVATLSITTEPGTGWLWSVRLPVDSPARYLQHDENIFCLKSRAFPRVGLNKSTHYFKHWHCSFIQWSIVWTNADRDRSYIIESQGCCIHWISFKGFTAFFCPKCDKGYLAPLVQKHHFVGKSVAAMPPCLCCGIP